MKQYITVLKQTEDGTPYFEMILPAVRFTRGATNKNTVCDAKLQCVAHKEGWRILLDVQGLQISVPLAELSALVETANDVLKGFGGMRCNK